MFVIPAWPVPEVLKRGRESRNLIAFWIPIFMGMTVLQHSLAGESAREESLKAAVVKAVKGYYYKELNLAELEKNSLPAIFEMLDKDSSLVNAQKKDSDYVRGFVRKKTIPESRRIGEDIAYIHIEYFSKTTAKEFRQIYLKFIDRGAKRWILDLRGNPGGDLESTFSFLEYFVPEGKVLANVEFRNGVTVYRSKNSKPYDLTPLVIWVDSRTASSAELVTSALKNAQKAKVWGLRTQGKRTVQKILPVHDQWLAITAGTWKTAEEKIEDCPIEPDVFTVDPERELSKEFKN